MNKSQNVHFILIIFCKYNFVDAYLNPVLTQISELPQHEAFS
jgi:hypothetical protein